MAEHLGRGDARRSMALLWGRWDPPKRGPKQALDVEEVVAAAIAIADAEGLAAVTMRRVAERLGRSAMSLYTYVPSKDELLDLMVDRVQAELPDSYDSSGGWRPALDRWARDSWNFYGLHPWLLQIAGGRGALGPNELDHYEVGLRLLDGVGLSPTEMSRAYGAVGSYLRGNAAELADTRAAETATGVSEDDWWYERSALLEEMVGDAWATRYPTLTRLSEAQAFDQVDRDPADTYSYLEREVVDAFEFGLERLLDGIEALVASKVIS